MLVSCFLYILTFNTINTPEYIYLLTCQPVNSFANSANAVVTIFEEEPRALCLASELCPLFCHAS